MTGVLSGEISLDRNTQIWDKIYESGSVLWYPAEALVRMVRRHERQRGFAGTILDHGCGSGNVAEFLVRSGHKVLCADVSRSALSIVVERFGTAGLEEPRTTLIDPSRALGGQLPAYDHVISWQSLCYCPRPVALDSIRQLIADLPCGGAFFLCLPTTQDTLYLNSEPLPDGSRQLRKDISSQFGAIITVPESTDELRSWCSGIEIRDIVEFGMRFDGEPSNFNAVYGVKP